MRIRFRNPTFDDVIFNRVNKPYTAGFECPETHLQSQRFTLGTIKHRRNASRVRHHSKCFQVRSRGRFTNNRQAQRIPNKPERVVTKMVGGMSFSLLLLFRFHSLTGQFLNIVHRLAQRSTDKCVRMGKLQFLHQSSFPKATTSQFPLVRLLDAFLVVSLRRLPQSPKV